MPAGIPGSITRAGQSTVEAEILDPTNYPTVYGVPVVIDATTKQLRKVMAADTPALLQGFYVRPYPTNNNQDGLGTSTPPTSGIANVLKRGYISVKLNVGTAVKEGIVYTRITANGGNTIIGGVEATADSTNTIIMANAFFKGPADASGNVEVAFNI